jgi:hypothetical protein
MKVKDALVVLGAIYIFDTLPSVELFVPFRVDRRDPSTSGVLPKIRGRRKQGHIDLVSDGA